MDMNQSLKSVIETVFSSEHLTSDDKLVAAVYLSHAIGRLPEELTVTDTKITREDAEWWATKVAELAKSSGSVGMVMEWVSYGPSATKEKV